MNQKQRVLKWFTNNSLLSKEKAASMGILSLSKVISELQKEGHKFEKGEFGYKLFKKKQNSWITLLTGKVS